MTHRASRSRPVGVRGALRWTTRASLARGADVAIHTEPGGPHPFKIIRSVSPTYLTSVVSTTSGPGPRRRAAVRQRGAAGVRRDLRGVVPPHRRDGPDLRHPPRQG